MMQELLTGRVRLVNNLYLNLIMNNFIFSVNEIFDVCLKEHKVEGYFIGPYQRGYKWKSETMHGQVPVLLCDLYDAFLKSSNKGKSTEYYLQYITVKRVQHHHGFYFEVIDGQQRLTTLTLIFCVLEWYFNEANITKPSKDYLLSYSRYECNELNIFDEILEFCNNKQFAIEKVREQDKFYMVQAVRCIKSFFDILKQNAAINFEPFIFYITENVKIILNKEDEFTSAEEVFSSLNANKVPLTDTYLIKGLLLTKASRDGARKHFKEIIDQRSLMAKNWDEMQNWFSRKEVGMYFFGNDNAGMDAALSLIRHMETNKVSEVLKMFREQLVPVGKKNVGQYELFNLFHEQTTTAGDAVNYLTDIKHLYLRLRNWYEDNLLYNLVGFCLATGGKLTAFLYLDNAKTLTFLQQHLQKQIEVKEGIENLMYPNKRIKNLLLAVSVFPEDVVDNTDSNYRFDFYSYATEGWSLEHIFPQNPGNNSLNYKDDKDWLINLCKKNGKEDIAKKIENDEEVSGDEISFIYDVFPNVHILGNMALLSGRVNAALSNGLFNTKRKILLNKINSGSFVPKHTIDIFSKMLEVKPDANGDEFHFDKDLMLWSENDAIAHLKWLETRVIQLKNIEFV